MVYGRSNAFCVILLYKVPGNTWIEHICSIEFKQTDKWPNSRNYTDTRLCTTDRELWQLLTGLLLIEFKRSSNSKPRLPWKIVHSWFAHISVFMYTFPLYNTHALCEHVEDSEWVASILGKAVWWSGNLYSYGIGFSHLWQIWPLALGVTCKGSGQGIHSPGYCGSKSFGIRPSIQYMILQ